MGVSCMRAKSEKDRKSKALDKIDITLLKLIYKDLAQRQHNNVLTKENFRIFFHLNGLWSDLLFRKFDKNQNKVIEPSQFLETITEVVGLSFEKKINQLFMIYDLDGQGAISYQSFVKILFSYPIQSLKIILSDKAFKNTLGKLEQSYYFNVENTINLQQSYNIDTQDEIPITHRKSKSMEILQISHQKYEEIENQQRLDRSAKLQKQMKAKSFEKRKKIMSLMNLNQQFTLKKISSQTIQSSEGEFDISDCILGKVLSDTKGTKYKIQIKKCKIVSSLTLMVKKFAKYIFHQNGQNGNYLSIQAFTKVVKQHPQIICPFQEGFHSYIWRLDENNLPKFISQKVKFQSQCQILQNDSRVQAYMKYIKNTVLVFKKKVDYIPVQIKCLEGLNVEAIKYTEPNQDLNGIIFKHKDGVYPENKYLFKTKKLQQDWIKALEQYKSNTILNHFQLRQIIGSGNYSKVWKAIQKEPLSPSIDCRSPVKFNERNKYVAIKIIDKCTLHQYAYQSIKFQCQLLALIHHPNIMRMITKQQTRSNIFIVTEFFNQGSLFQYCQQKEFLDEYEAAIITKQLLEAVEYLTDLGIVHRDLKPENVMVIYDQKKKLITKVKIIDFGFATYLQSLKEVQQDRRAKGTPGFVPPEAFLAKTYYENSDLFSIGVMLYQMLSGQLPFQGNSVQHILLKTVECNLQFNNKSNTFSWHNISEDAKDLLKKLITTPQSRLSVSQALNHKWLLNIQKLKQQRKTEIMSV